MDAKNRRLLQHHQQDIVQDLDVTYILDDLFTKNVITNEDFDHIYNLTNRVERTRYLIDKLLQYGSNSSYEAFVDSLAKDYKWLWEKLAVGANDQIMNDSFEDSLSKGDVPRLPEHHVRREALEQVVASKLKDLTRHKILALHGMSGCGKTCVVISVLRDNPELITNNFNGVVFWMNFGTCKTDDDIVSQQNKLLRKISSMFLNNSYMITSISMSSIASNGDSHSLSNYDYNWQDLRDRLKSQFMEQPIKEALLVLDEVNDRKCLDAFDIGCKILITTRDTDVVTNYHPVIVNIENSFKEKESLEMFASYLDMPVSKLPSQAKKLNEICKGNPFQLALIGAQLAENKDRLKHDPAHWKYYVNKLEKKDYFFLWKTNDKPMKTIELCINSLDDNILPLYKRLTVLPDNVKISARVLSKLWNKEITEVESILKKLRSKSLIIETYDREHKNYLYEVQDLIMNYLRSTTNEEDMKKLHSEFLNSYHYDNINKTSAEMLDDGYIAYYIGYHIMNTKNLNQKWGLFNKLFLDLQFLGNKVRLTGPDDVMLDLQKYESYIAKDDLDKDLIYNIKAFLSTHGTDLYRYPCTDIIQSILQHVSTGILYTKASLIAQNNCDKNELYFEFMHEHDVEELKHSTIDVKESITSVCFLGNHVLVGTAQGLIKFFHMPTNKLKKELTGSGSPIKWIGVVCSKNPPIVAALFADGTVKLWYVDDINEDEDTDTIEEEPEEAYNNNYPTSSTIDPGLGAILNCRWADNEDLLFMHTAKLVIMCRPTGERAIIDNFERDRNLLCCVPCDNDRYIAVATSNDVDKYVEVVDRKTKERLIVFDETDFVKDMVVVPGTNKIITLKNSEVSEHEFKVKSASIDKRVFCKTRCIITGDAVKANLCFTSITVNKTGTLLFVSTDDSRVVCVDMKTHTRVFDIENRRGNVIAVAVSEVLMWDEFEPGSDVLLTGTDNTENSAKVWYLDPSYVSQNAQKTGKVRLTTKFDVSFLNAASPISPVTSTSNSNAESTTNTPQRHQSFANHKEVAKKPLKNSMSLDRNALKLNLRGICNNNDSIIQPLLAVVDDKNNIQVMRGRKVLGEILEKSDEYITTVKISPCNHFVFYGLHSGEVRRYTLRTKEIVTILDVYSPVQYLNFVNANLLIVAGKNRCLMAYRLTDEGDWKPEMLQRGNTYLGSQELLNVFQGVKKKNGPADKVSTSSSESSIESRDRLFRSGDIKSLCKGSGLIDCFWIDDTGLLTVEYNASIKLWNKDLKMSIILFARHTDVHISCAAFQKNVLVICDSENKKFQTFQLKTNIPEELHAIQEYKLNNVITSCNLSSDGHILAMGLDSGNVVVWNVKAKRQIALLKHHQSKVQSCSFSPVPDRLPTSNTEACDDQPPLVLVTMASEIVWWNISHIIKTRSKTVWRSGWNAMTPAGTPLENRSAVQSPVAGSKSEPPNFFFADGLLNQHCWRFIWRGKIYKEGSKRKEILACIKLSGVNAKKLCHDDRFSCFVTVDNPGHVHVMNIMRSNCS